MTDKRRNLLLITRNFPPLCGGMERLVHHIYLELQTDFEISLVGPKGCGSFLNSKTYYRSVSPSPLSRFLIQMQWQAFQAARNAMPDLVFSASGLNAPAAVLAGRWIRRPVAGYLHGLDIIAGHPLYRAFFLPAIRSWDHVLANSRHTAELAKDAGVDPVRMEVLHPGVSLADVPDSGIHKFRWRYQLGSRPLLLSVGRLTERKGILEFIRYCLPQVVQDIPDALYLVVGDEARNAGKASTVTAAGVLDAVMQSGLRNHVLLLGAVDDETLSRAYTASRVLVFPVIERRGDVEGFGMVAVEAAAHGTPTVAFRVGGISDAVYDGVSGRLIAPGDYTQMASALIGMLKTDKSEACVENCRTFAAQFTWERFGQRLRASCNAWLDTGRNSEQ